MLRCCEYLAQKEGFEVTCLPVDRDGLVSPDSLAKPCGRTRSWFRSWRPITRLAPSNRSQNWAQFAESAACVFHTDAVQWFGKEPFESIHQFNADLVSICAHKIHGPKGAGALYVKSPLQPAPIMLGGSHENERRAGTENLAGIIGLVEALERFVHTPVFDR